MRFSVPKMTKEEERARNRELLGEVDLWSLFTFEQGGEVLCTKDLTLAYYAASAKTVAIRVIKHNASAQVAELEVYGPEAWVGGHLYAHYEVRGRVLRKNLSREEQWVFGEALTNLTNQSHPNPTLKSPRSGANARRMLGLPLDAKRPKRTERR